MYRLLTFALIVALLAACTGSTPTEAPPDPIPLVTEAAENIREMDSFRMIVEQTGAPYYILTDLGEVQFRRAEAQYLAPDIMQADVRLITAVRLPAEVTVFSRAADQWFANDIITGGNWVNLPFSPGFNPETLIAAESGFQASLAAMIDMQYVGQETLESGAPVYHLKATAQGEDVTALLAGLIYMTGPVNVDVYVHREMVVPVRFIITVPNSVTEEEPEPTTWTIDIYDFNTEMQITYPDTQATESPDATESVDAPQSLILTPQATAEETPND